MQTHVHADVRIHIHQPTTSTCTDVYGVFVRNSKVGPSAYNLTTYVVVARSIHYYRAS